MLIRKQRDIEQLRDMLLEGALSPVVGEMDVAYFDRLRQRARTRQEVRQASALVEPTLRGTLCRPVARDRYGHGRR